MKLSKRVIAVVLSAGLVLCNFSTTASAENKSLTTNYPPSDKSQISYSTSDYTLYCISRVKVKCKSDYRSMWSNLDKGDKIGEATVRAYYLEPKKQQRVGTMLWQAVRCK